MGAASGTVVTAGAAGSVGGVTGGVGSGGGVVASGVGSTGGVAGGVAGGVVLVSAGGVVLEVSEGTGTVGVSMAASSTTVQASATFAPSFSRYPSSPLVGS